MSFQTPITIKDAIQKIETNQYLLPGIQREFIWKYEKIEWLFDSIMKEYPISSFLFWEVHQESARNHNFYKFINEYREDYKTHNEHFYTFGNDSFTAILDGQQRLNSLFIGLKGSYAYRGYRKKREDSEKSIPTRYLYLNITRNLENQEDGREYNFKFLKKLDTNGNKIYKNQDGIWFRVGAILNYTNPNDLDNYLDNNLDGCVETVSKENRTILRQLRKVIIDDKTINFFLEQDQDLNKALNIFIRVNSGAHPLDFSDLVMSIAVDGWNGAREEIHRLVDTVRSKGFNISKDLILKAYLYLHSKDIKFRVTNFNKENAKDLEKHWVEIRDCILETFELLRTFGFQDYTLISKNAVLPIIYYLYHKRIYDGFSTKMNFSEERKVIKKWLHIVLIKKIFGASSDTVLSQIRKEFTDDVTKKPFKKDFDSFPNTKGFSVDSDFIEELLLTQKDDKYAFSILSLIYPYQGYSHYSYDKDHLHPKIDFEKLTEKDKAEYKWEKYNSICNLQLLISNENSSKNGCPLKDWVEEKAKISSRAQVLEQHIIPDIDLSIENFGEFFEERKKLLIERLKNLLN